MNLLERLFRIAWLVLGLYIVLPAGHAPAQATDAEDETPLVERLTFEGVESVEEDEIAGTLATEATRCYVFLLKPLCALTHSKLFEARKYLDRDQLRRDMLRIKVFYWRRGFRHAQVDTAVAPRGRGVAVTFQVAEGPPTLIETIAVEQPREVLDQKTLGRYGLPQRGDRIDMTRLDTLRTKVRRVLWDRGYGNAEVRDSAAPLDSLRVALRITVAAGALTYVDTIRVEGNEKVSDRTVQRLVGMQRGDLYKRAELLEAQRRLYRSDLFRQMLLASPDSADSLKTIVVTVREAPMRAVEAGGGYNTIDYAQLQGHLTLYNFHGTARRVDFRSALGNLGASGGPTWQASASVTQPWFLSYRNSFGVSVFSNRRRIPDVVIDRGTGASATFTHTRFRDIPLSLTYRYERTRIEAGQLYFCINFGNCRLPTISALQQSNSFSPLVLSLRADRTDDPLMPTTGYTARFDVQHASAVTGSDWRFNRFEGEVAPYLKMGRRTLVLRAHAGRVTGSSSSLTEIIRERESGIILHPRTRFYGGGARSVRGYAEGQLGPRVLTIDPLRLIEADTTRGTPCTLATIADATCDPNAVPSKDFVPRPVGGNTLLEGTIEYRLPITRSIGAAVFVDAGRVGGNNLGELLKARSAVTPGLGFRYLSPIGPVRVDLGVRPKRQEELAVVTQAEEADGTLRLVELQTPKRYDPAEGPHGFLGGFFSRLQLHLYIGEAY